MPVPAWPAAGQIPFPAADRRTGRTARQDRMHPPALWHTEYAPHRSSAFSPSPERGRPGCVRGRRRDPAAAHLPPPAYRNSAAPSSPAAERRKTAPRSWRALP